MDFSKVRNGTTGDRDKEAIRLVAQAAVPIAIGVKEVEAVSASDQELNTVRQCILTAAYDTLPDGFRNVC